MSADKPSQPEASQEAITMTRARIDIKVGAYVCHAGTVYKIAQVLDFNTVIGIAVESGHNTPLAINALRSVDDATLAAPPDLNDIADAEWREAERRLAIIKPIADKMLIGRKEMEDRAKQSGVSVATLYRWINRYRGTGSALGLINRRRGWESGKSRLSRETDALVEEVIQDFYLQPVRPTAEKTIREIRRRCEQRSVAAPSKGTIRARISAIPERIRLRARGENEKAKNKYMPASGKFPNADYPLAVVQIDHTPADIILVDDAHRKPIGRPWLTVAMDVYSRMIVGYYLSFDAPSETSVAMCVAHAALPKDAWLMLHKVDAEWPVWGLPKTIHVDNGPDFRSGNFRQSCLAHDINLEFRPVRQPRYGGHIERVIGSLLTEIHDLPGTTFSSVKDRKGYDPEKNATMTMAEFENWLVTLICKVYHERLHTGIGMSPRKKWEIGVFGNATVQGVGLPRRIVDPHSLLLDFLPSFRRTVQTFGVTIEGMNYYAESLRPWINAEDPDNHATKRSFIFRRDPRDISAIWFHDPDLKQYFKVPFADQSLPSMSAWEHAQVKASLRREGAESLNAVQVSRGLTELRGKVDASTERTKKARRQAQRRVEHHKKVVPANPLPKKQALEPPNASPALFDLSKDAIEGFGDIA